MLRPYLRFYTLHCLTLILTAVQPPPRYPRSFGVNTPT